MSLFGAQTQSKQPVIHKGGWRLLTSTSKTLPCVLGTDRVPGNFLGLFDFRAHAHKGSGKGQGGGQAELTYSETLQIGLCRGPIHPTGLVGRIWKASGASEVLNKTARARWIIVQGNPGQAPLGYMSSNHPGAALGYSSVAYAFEANDNLGTSTSPAQFSFEVFGALAIDPNTNPDANPADIINYILTDSMDGLGGFFPSSWLDLTSNAVRNYFAANNLFLSLMLDQAQKTSDVLKMLAEVCNGDFRWSGGVYQFIPYGDLPVTANGVTWTPNLTPVYDFTDDDFIANPGEAPITVTYKKSIDQFNRVQVEFLSRANNYDVETTPVAELQDLVQLYGPRPDSTRQFHAIKNPLTAQQVAQTLVQRHATVIRNYKFKVSNQFHLLDVLDIVSAAESSQWTGARPMRVVGIIEDPKERTLSIEAEDLGVNTPQLYPTQPRTGNSGPGGGSVPVDINPPVFIQPTYPLAKGVQRGYAELWVAVSGQNQSENWGGAEVFFSEDNVSFESIGRVTSPAAMGSTLATLNASAADPDNSQTLQVDLSESGGVVSTVSNAKADSHHNLAWLGGEFVAFTTVAAGANAFQYNLTRLRRHLYQTPNLLRASGSDFVYLGFASNLDPGIFRWSYPTGLIGKTVYFKFLSFNEALGETIDNSTVYSVVLNGNAKNTGKNRSPDSNLKSVTAFWPNQSSGNLVHKKGAGINGTHAFTYTGNGGAAPTPARQVSAPIPVTPGETVVIHCYLDATFATVGSPQLYAARADLTALNPAAGSAFAPQFAGQKGRVATWFDVPAMSLSTVARRASGTSSGDINATNVNVALGAGVADGDLVIVNINLNDAIALTPPAGYIQLVQESYFGGSASDTVFYHVWHTGDPTTVNFSWTGSKSGSYQTSAYSGADSTPVLVQAVQANGSGTMATSPSVTPTSVGDMLLMIYGVVNGGITFSSPSVGSIAVQGPNTHGAAAITDLLLSSGSPSGAQTITLSSASTSAGIQVAIKPASSAVTSIVLVMDANGATVTNAKDLAWSTPQVEAGQDPTDYEVNNAEDLSGSFGNNYAQATAPGTIVTINAGNGNLGTAQNLVAKALTVISGSDEIEFEVIFAYTFSGAACNVGGTIGDQMDVDVIRSDTGAAVDVHEIQLFSSNNPNAVIAGKNRHMTFKFTAPGLGAIGSITFTARAKGSDLSTRGSLSVTIKDVTIRIAEKTGSSS